MLQKRGEFVEHNPHSYAKDIEVLLKLLLHATNEIERKPFE